MINSVKPNLIVSDSRGAWFRATILFILALIGTVGMWSVVVFIPDIEKEFGSGTAMLVKWLTDTSRPEDGNRAIRKGIDRERLSQAPAAAQLIKAADMISNGKDIKQHDPSFAKVYIEEMKLLLDAMTKIQSMDIYKEAKAVVDG